MHEVVEVLAATGVVFLALVMAAFVGLLVWLMKL